MGLNAYARKDSKHAEELLRKAIELTGDDKARNNYQIRRAYYVLGRICIQTGRKDEGVAYTKVFSEMQDKTMADSRANTPASKTQGTMGSGMAGEPSVPTTAVINPDAQLGDTPQLTPQEKAEVKTAEQRVSLILGNAYNDLGTSEARQKQYAVALSYFQQAEKWNPAIPHLMRNIGFAAFRANDYSESCPRLEAGRAAGTRRQNHRPHARHGAVFQRTVRRRGQGLRSGRRRRLLRSARGLRLGDVAGTRQSARQSRSHSRPFDPTTALARCAPARWAGL